MSVLTDVGVSLWCVDMMNKLIELLDVKRHLRHCKKITYEIISYF